MNVTLIRASFDALRPQAPALANRFYEILFERYPQVKPMFAKTDFSKQKQMLIQALSLLVANLEKPEILKAYLGVLGAKHAGYGATDAQYDAVGECLLATLAEFAGPLWTPELAGEWAETYGAVAFLMKEGAATAAGV
jgi:methyl-accepting chemotaxis protein